MELASIREQCLWFNIYFVIIKSYMQFWRIFLFLCAVKAACGSNAELKLIRAKMKNYDLDVRPSSNQSATVNVYMDMTVHQILELDEKHELLTSSVWQRLRWHDAGLQWNPEDYGGIRRIRLSIKRIWKPDITLVNNVREDMKQDSTFQATVSSDGTVSWNIPRLLRSSCTLNIVYFPWDTQVCNLQFASWTHDGSELALYNMNDKADTTDYVENGEWELLGTPIIRDLLYAPCCAEPFSYLNFNIELLRRSGYYVENLIFPSVLITAAGMLVFLLPPESGEKVSLSVTILLATTVYQLIVTDYIPVQSKVFPIIGVYMMVTQLLLAFSMMLTVLVLNIHHQGDTGRELPGCLCGLLSGWFGRILCLSDSTSHLKKHARRRSSCSSPVVQEWELDRDIAAIGYANRFVQHQMLTSHNATDPRPGLHGYRHKLYPNNPESTTGPQSEDISNLAHSMKKVTISLGNIETWLRGKKRDEVVKLEWLLLAKALDRIFLFLYIVCFVVATVAILKGHLLYKSEH